MSSATLKHAETRLLDYSEPQLPCFEDIHSRIFELFQDTLKEDFTLSKSLKGSLSAKTFKIILGTGGMLGRIPLIPLSLDFNKTIPVLGSISAASNFISYSAYLIWASSKMINQITFSIKSDECLQKHILGNWKKIALLACNILNGITAQIPYFVLSYDYNQTKPLMVLLNALDVTLPIYSMQLLITNHIASLTSSSFEKKLVSLKSALSSSLQKALNAMIKDPTSLFIDELNNQHLTIQQKLDSLFFKLDTLEASPVFQQTSKTDQVISYSSKTLGLFLLSVQMAWFALLCKQGMEKITSNEGLIISFCLYVIICNIALTHFVLIGSSHQVLHGIKHLFKGSTPTYLAESLAPKASLIAKIFSLVICSSAIIPAAQMSKDYLPTSLYYPSTFSYGLGFVLMDYLPLRDLLNDAITFYLTKKGTDSQKQILQLTHQIEELKSIIENSNLKSLALFLLKMEQSTFCRRFFHQHQITIADLCSYVAPHNIPAIEVI